MDLERTEKDAESKPVNQQTSQNSRNEPVLLAGFLVGQLAGSLARWSANQRHHQIIHIRPRRPRDDRVA